MRYHFQEKNFSFNLWAIESQVENHSNLQSDGIRLNVDTITAAHSTGYWFSFILSLLCVSYMMYCTCIAVTKQSKTCLRWYVVLCIISVDRTVESLQGHLICTVLFYCDTMFTHKHKRTSFNCMTILDYMWEWMRNDLLTICIKRCVPHMQIQLLNDIIHKWTVLTLA